VNFPNQLTVGRIVLTLVMVVFLTFPSIPWGKTLALVVFLLASLTDYWDGRLARTYGKISVFGQFMDPLADKILVCAAFVSFATQRQIVPAWIVILIISREFLITGLRLLAAQRGEVLSAGRWGKHKMVWQTLAILAIMGGLALREDLLPRLLRGSGADTVTATFEAYFRAAAFVISALVCVLTLVSGGVYLWQNRALYRAQL